jgi:hypothetical protein
MDHLLAPETESNISQPTYKVVSEFLLLSCRNDRFALKASFFSLSWTASRGFQTHPSNWYPIET